MSKKYLIVIEQIRKEFYEMELKGSSAMEVLDQARAQVNDRNKKCPAGTIFTVKKVEEIENEECSPDSLYVFA
jgi:hypothetical protein